MKKITYRKGGIVSRFSELKNRIINFRISLNLRISLIIISVILLYLSANHYAYQVFRNIDTRIFVLLAFVSISALILTYFRKKPITDQESKRTPVKLTYLVILLSLILAVTAIIYFKQHLIEISYTKSDELKLPDSLAITEDISADKPSTPYFQQGDTCSVNLKELQIIANYERDHQKPEFANYPMKINLEILGTDVFRVTGKFTSEHVLDLPDTDGIIAMKVSSKDRVAMQLRFSSKAEMEKMKTNEYYEIIGKMHLNDKKLYEIHSESEESPAKRKGLPAYLEVKSWKKVSAPASGEMIEKFSFTPPYNPTE